MESKSTKSKLISRGELLHRLGRSAAVGCTLILFSLTIGIVGYHWIGGLSWIDAFLDACMILSGMGPVSALHTSAAKFFAGCYAVYCGVMLLAITGVILAPVIHRSLHKFHMELNSGDK